MENSFKKSERSFSIGQMILIGIGVLILAFIIIGTINDASTTEETFSFAPQQPFFLLALLAFAGGVLSFLSPCTLPILPAYFAFAVSSGRRQIALNTVVFMLGVATMFSAFGAGASALGSVLRQNQDLILLLGGALVIVFGVMSLLGKGFTGFSQDEEKVRSGSLGGSFLFGMTFAAGWSTCIGPILGIVLTMAATTGSVVRGTMLLFIFALGLGLPLIIVSTFIGRASRQSLIWRVMRGKGWFLTVPAVVIAIVWGLAIWWILSATVDYAFINFDFFGNQEITTLHMIGLLVLAFGGAFLWVFTGSGNKKTEIHLHSTSIISGVLFIILGVLMINGQMTAITAQFAGGEAFLPQLEEALYNLVAQ